MTLIKTNMPDKMRYKHQDDHLIGGILLIIVSFIIVVCVSALYIVNKARKFIEAELKAEKESEIIEMLERHGSVSDIHHLS
jgi:hypothetical protein